MCRVEHWVANASHEPVLLLWTLEVDASHHWSKEGVIGNGARLLRVTAMREPYHP